MADPQGFALIHRRLLGHPAFRNDAEAMAFAWLIVRASWQPTRVRYKGHQIDLARGELAISVRDMAEAHERPKGWVERLLTRLKNETMIETRAGTDARTAPLVISIMNYDTYQAFPGEARTASRTPSGTAPRTGPGQHPDTEQQDNKGTKVIEANASKPIKRVKPAPIDMPEGVEPQVWTDFQAHRKAKGAPITATALAGITREAAKAGWKLNDALREVCNRGWQGFNASWVDKGNNRNGQHRNGTRTGSQQVDGFTAALRHVSGDHPADDY